MGSSEPEGDSLPCLMRGALVTAKLQDWARRWLSGKESPTSARSAGDTGLIPRLGRSPGEGNGNLFLYSGQRSLADDSLWGCEGSDVTEHSHTHA